MTYLWLLLNYIIGCDLVWFWIGSNYLSEASFDFPSSSTCFSTPNMSLWAQNRPKPWFWLYLWVWFGLVGFGLVPMAHLRLPWNFPAQAHAFWYPACHCRPKNGQNHDFGYIFGFSLIGFGFGYYFGPDLECHGKDGSNDTSYSSIGLKTPNISRDIYSGVRILF